MDIMLAHDSSRNARIMTQARRCSGQAHLHSDFAREVHQLAGLRSGAGRLGEEYILSSVDHAITDEARQKREAEAELAAIFDARE
jgi:hypothetical protein